MSMKEHKIEEFIKAFDDAMHATERVKWLASRLVQAAKENDIQAIAIVSKRINTCIMAMHGANRAFAESAMGFATQAKGPIAALTDMLGISKEREQQLVIEELVNLSEDEFRFEVEGAHHDGCSGCKADEMIKLATEERARRAAEAR